MAIPPIFAKDEHTAKLAAYFEDMYGYLLEQGVPAERLPSPWHILSHVVDCLDAERIEQWVEAYVELEGRSRDALSPDTSTPVQATKRPRPAYLRALTEDAAREDDT